MDRHEFDARIRMLAERLGDLPEPLGVGDCPDGPKARPFEGVYLALEAVAAERRRIGQDLHDSLGQMLTGAAYLSKALEARLVAKHLPEAAGAAEIANHITDCIALMRSVCVGLTPVKAQAGWLMEALGRLAADAAKLFGVSCVFRCPKPLRVPDDVVGTHVYRIAQEAVTNAIRHGKASEIVIGLEAGDSGAARLTVQDDGTGPPANLHDSSGLGIPSMKLRASQIEGKLDVKAGPNAGTMVVCEFQPGSLTEA